MLASTPLDIYETMFFQFYSESFLAQTFPDSILFTLAPFWVPRRLIRHVLQEL